MTRPKVGLVLSGGGAKGAYQAGVLRALAETGIEVDVVSGASIGALNGAMVASAASVDDAADRLKRVWTELAQSPLFDPNYPAYLRLLLGAGQALACTTPPTRLVAAAATWMLEAVNEHRDVPTSLFTDVPLKALLDKYLDAPSLANGRPLWVSVFRSHGILQDLGRDAVATLGLVDTPDSEFRLLQSLPDNQQRECLLASAALPLIFKRRRLEDGHYSDGGQGGWRTVQGNTPITPLLGEDCDVIIVSHLQNGSFWQRPTENDRTVIVELRPREPISKRATDLLGFDHDRISAWMRQGYEETMLTLAEVADVLRVRQVGRAAEETMKTAISLADDNVRALHDRLAKRASRRTDLA